MTGRFVKGEKRPNQGKRGPDKTTKDVKNAILMVAENLGGVPRMTAWAQEDEKNERLFWSSIYPKVLPKEIKSEIAATHVIQKMPLDQLRGVLEAVIDAKSK